MKKLCLLMIFMVLFMLLCGCGKFTAICSIDEWNNAEMKFFVEIPKDYMTEEDKESFEDIIYVLYDHWENMGYFVDYTFVGGSYDIALKKRTLAKNRKSAFNELMEMMSSDTSPFSFVEGGYSKSFFSDVYNIKAEVDLSKIVDYEYIETLPPSQKNKILDAIDKFTGTVTFDLPGEIINSIGNNNGNKNTVNLSLNETTEIYSLMEVQNAENRLSYDTLLNEIAQLENTKQLYILIVSAAGGAAVITIVLMLILIAKRKKRSAKSDIITDN